MKIAGLFLTEPYRAQDGQVTILPVRPEAAADRRSSQEREVHAAR